MLIVLTGPASSGKDTILLKLLEKHPNFKRVVTTTTRPPRSGEVNGVDYNFASRARFEEMIKNNEMLEYVDFSGDFYGTTKDAIGSGDLIWRVETSRAAKAEEVLPENVQALVIYIDSPDWKILENRMKVRGMTEDQIRLRLTKDKEDFEKYGSAFKHIVMNEEGKLASTIDKIEQIIENRS